MIKATRNSGVALGLAWSTFAVEQLLQQAFPFFWQHDTIVNYAMAAVVGYSVLAARLRSDKPLATPPVPLLAMYLLLAFAILSFFWSAAPSATLAQLTKWGPYLLVFVIIAPFSAIESTAVTTAVKVTVFFGGLVIFNLLFSNFGRRSVILELASGQQVEGNPLAIADYASTVAIFGLFVLFGRPAKMLQKITITAIIIGAGYVLLKSQCRGQMLAVFATATIWLPITCREMRNKSFVLPAVAIGGLCLAAVMFMQQNSLTNRWSSAAMVDDGDSRFGMMSLVLSNYQQGGYLTWIVGLGNSVSFKLFSAYPHNVPVEVLCEEGLIGGLLFLVFVGGTVKLNLNLLKQRNIPEAARFNLGLLLALFTFHAGISLKQGSLMSSFFMLSFGACLCLAGQRYHGLYAKPGKSTTLERRAPVAQTSTGLIHSLQNRTI